MPAYLYPVMEKRHNSAIPRDFGRKAADHISEQSEQSEGVGIWTASLTPIFARLEGSQLTNAAKIPQSTLGIDETIIASLV
jgi:hypothetical protein